MPEFFLSPQQKRLWLLQTLEKRGFITRCCVSVSGPLQTELLTTVLEEITCLYDILRTTYVRNKDLAYPLQQVTPYKANACGVQYADWRNHWSEDRLRDIYLQEPADADECLQWEQPVRYHLIRKSDHEHRLIVHALALNLDGASLQHLVEKIFRCYEARRAGNASPLPAAVIQYTQYAEWLQSNLDDQTIGYWKQDEFRPANDLHLQNETEHGREQGSRRNEVMVEVGQELKERTDHFIRTSQLDKGRFYFICWTILLHRLSGNNQFVAGLADHGKDYEELSDTLGLMDRMLPVPVHFDENDTFHTVARRIGRKLDEMAEWKDYYIPAMPAATGKEGDHPAIAWCFDYLDHISHNDPGDELTVNIIRHRAQPDTYRLKGEVTNHAGSTYWRLEYDERYFTAEEAGRIAGYYRQLIASVVAAPDKPVQRLALLNDAETERLLHHFNNSRLDVPDASVTALFAACVKRHPLATAVSNGDVSLSYEALDRHANRLAHCLQRECGVGSGEVVALLTDRSPYMIAGMLGILKAGAAWLGIDPGWPEGRIATVLQQARCRTVVTEASFSHMLPRDIKHVYITGEHLERHSSEEPDISTHAKDLAYVIFTSGSTGVPKGVMIDHATIVNLVYGLKHHLGFAEGAGARFSLFASIAFDASVQQIFSALLTGNCLCIMEDAVKKDLARLTQFLQHYRIEVFDCTPSVLQLLLEEAPEAYRKAPLKTVLVGGEAWSDKLVSLFFRKHLHSGDTEYVNVYGPTECGVDSTYFSLKGQPECPFIPIGKPLPNKKIFILDKWMQPVPIGVTGELYIGGNGIAKGYLNNETLTQEVFMPSVTGTGEVMYKSGDLGTWLPDGNIRFLGRHDDQVKIRGYRIELTEISSVLRQHGGVDDAFVYLSERVPGQKTLAAAIVPHRNTAYTVRRVNECRKNDPAGAASLYRLPGGYPLWYANKSELELVYDEIFNDRVYERFGIRIGKGDVVFDAGANIGLFSLYLGLHHPGITLYAFEPVEEVFTILQRNLSLYPFAAQVFNVGLSDKSGTVTFNYYPLNTVLSGRYGNEEEERTTVAQYLRNKSGAQSPGSNEMEQLLHEGIESKAIECRMTTLSEFLQQHPVERIDLLKIDVEKSEWEVLQGITPGDWKKIRQLVLEVHDRNDTLQRIEQLLREQGFTVHTEQDALLRNTCLYNVYALRADMQNTITDTTRPSTQWVDDQALLADIKTLAQKQLPEYMVPVHWQMVNELPLNQNGKTDRQALMQLEEPVKEVKSEAPLTPMEQLLAGIWKEVLGAEAVSAADDFFMIGGDSIKAIQVSSRLHKAGYKITIRDILYHPVLSDLAPLVKPLKKNDSVDLVSGVVPLLPVQHEFFAAPRQARHHFNMSMMFFSPTRMTADLVRAMFACLWQHHDALRMIFVQRNGEWIQENRGTDSLYGFEELDLTAEAGYNQNVLSVVNRLQASLDLAQGPLLKAALLHTGDGDRLLVIVHHLVMDGVSWRILFEDIEALLQQYRNGRELKLPQKTHSYKDWATQLVQYANSEEVLRERSYWQKIEETPADLLPPPPVPADNKAGDARDIVFSLPQHETQLLLTQANKVYNTKTQELLLAALTMSLNECWSLRRIALTMEAHGRENIPGGPDISRTVGWFTSLYPAMLHADADTDLATHIRETKSALAGVPNNGIGYGLLKWITDRKHTTGMSFRLKPEISFNYMGQFDEDIRQLTLQPATDPLGNTFDPADRRDHVLDIVSHVSGGQLKVAVWYPTAYYREEKIHQFTASYKKQLQRLLEHCLQVKPLQPATA